MVPTNLATAPPMEDKTIKSAYCMELPDWEDSLSSTRGLVWRDAKGRIHVHGLWYSLLFPLILVAGLFVAFQAISDPKETVLAVIATIFVAWAGYSSYRWARPKDFLPPFFHSVREATAVFGIEKGKSFGAIISIPLVLFFVVLERVFPRRFVPLGVIVRITLATTLASLFVA